MNIRTKKLNNKIAFNLYDISIYLISDIESIQNKLNYMNINIDLNIDYIDLYTFILLIAFSNDSRIHKYKLYLAYNTLEKIQEINNPSILIDKANSIKYIKENIYKYNKNTIKDIITKEIENSYNINIFRHII